MIVLLYLADEDAENWASSTAKAEKTSEGTGVQEEEVTKEVENFLQNLREP